MRHLVSNIYWNSSSLHTLSGTRIYSPQIRIPGKWSAYSAPESTCFYLPCSLQETGQNINWHFTTISGPELPNPNLPDQNCLYGCRNNSFLSTLQNLAHTENITVFMTDVRISYITLFHQLRYSQLGPALPCTQNQFLIPFIFH